MFLLNTIQNKLKQSTVFNFFYQPSSIFINWLLDVEDVLTLKYKYLVEYIKRETERG